MEEKNTIKENMVDVISRGYLTISTVLIVLLGIGIFQPVTAKYLIFIFIVNIIFFLIGKDLADKKYEKLSRIYFNASILLLSYGFIAAFMRKMKEVNTTGKPLNLLGLMLSIGVTIFLVYLYLDDKTKEVFNNIYDSNLAIKLKLANVTDTLAPGDLILCRNKQTNEPVIIPHKDRYVHQLVLGPTGSGKTSQILIPSILQDMKTLEHGITVIEPKGDLAEQVDAMGKIYDREVIYFNPIYPDCPYFNPLYGPENKVVENVSTVFKMLANSSNQYFSDLGEVVLKNALMVVKRVKGDAATLIDVSLLLQDTNGLGHAMVKEFMQLNPESTLLAKQNAEIAGWFLDEYYNDKSKTFDNSSGLRNQVTKIVSNEYLRKVLNPPNGRNDLNFDDILANGKVLAISTAQGELRELSSYLGYFIIFSYQSSVFRRPGTEDVRRPHFLYIDEFQTYSNPGFSDMLTQGRSYRVGCTLATQARDQMAMGGGKDGDNFVKLVSTNARSVILFPGISGSDAEYYSKELGEIEVVEESKSTSTPRFSLFGGGSGNGSESISEKAVLKPRYTPSQLRYKEFKEITYSLVIKDTLQFPGDGLIDFIPLELHQKISSLVEEFREDQLQQIETNSNVIKVPLENINMDPLNGKEYNSTDDGDSIFFEEGDNKVFVDNNFEYKDKFINESSDGKDDVI